MPEIKLSDLYNELLLIKAQNKLIIEQNKLLIDRGNK